MANWRITSEYALLIAAATLWACKGNEKPADQPPARDLSLAPAESTAQINDRPTDQPAAQPKAVPPPPKRATPQPKQPAAQPQPRQPAKVETPTVGEGTSIDLAASDTVTSRKNKKGEAITAVAGSAVKDASGREVIPAGAQFSGTISDIGAASSPGGKGRLVLTFDRVSFGGKNYPVEARTDTVGTFMKGRGVTTTEAAKVGAGAAVGAIAGRLLGGNKKGTIIGGVAGAAAGTGVAAATRDVDIIMPAGALIRIVLTAPFQLKEATE